MTYPLTQLVSLPIPLAALTLGVRLHRRHGSVGETPRLCAIAQEHGINDVALLLAAITGRMALISMLVDLDASVQTPLRQLSDETIAEILLDQTMTVESGVLCIDLDALEAAIRTAAERRGGV